MQKYTKDKHKNKANDNVDEFAQMITSTQEKIEDIGRRKNDRKDAKIQKKNWKLYKKYIALTI